jgi:hypothetical protein
MEARSEPDGEIPTAESSTDETTHPPGWFVNPDGPGLRYWDGQRWTESFHPGYLSESPTRRELMWALALGFGATGGVVGFLSIPVAAFYFPLGFGAAGIALAIVALTQEGDTPWYALIAVIASIAALALGIDAYNEFNDVQDDFQQNLREELQQKS